MKRIVLALDTANETIAVGVGSYDPQNGHIALLAQVEEPAFRASNTKLVSCIQQALNAAGVSRADIGCVVCGRGPGSFTGVRICLATAKGIALGLGVALHGVSTSDARAWRAHRAGVRGDLIVLGDAMRKEVYPVRYRLADDHIDRFNSDCVIKAAAIPEWIGGGKAQLSGDALAKYRDDFLAAAEERGARWVCTEESLWAPDGASLLRAFEQQCQESGIDPFDADRFDPSLVLPVYTRLSDAEEAERQKKAQVQALGELDAAGEAQESSCPESGVMLLGDASHNVTSVEGATIKYVPMDARWISDVAALESEAMGSDAWSASALADELGRADRTWWAAFSVADPDAKDIDTAKDELVGYAGGWIVDADMHILKVATAPAWRRHGIAVNLLDKIAQDARDLGATQATLEVRASNEGARKLYETLGLKDQGKRPHYYSDREDAHIYTGPLPIAVHDVAGMDLRINDAAQGQCLPANQEQGVAFVPPFIVAFETSCDETAAALVDGKGRIVADVVASQIDFHSRFGGVVPEIASRKHIEAISGVAQELMVQTKGRLGEDFGWKNVAAVGVTYAPGLVAALVVGMAFAKGLSWALDVPLIGVNHLEGHIYANRLDDPQLQPPMIVSLVSGGHTQLVHVKDWGSYVTLGSTLDDAVGEAFDKVAKALGLGYPGGPRISELAKAGDPKAIDFPRALLKSGDYAFSLSGLKTAVMTYLKKQEDAGLPINKPDVCSSFQQAVIDVQVAKALQAIKETGAQALCIGGGVAANPALRSAYEQVCKQEGIYLHLPPLSACTDNASMIALVALDRYKQGKFMGADADIAAHAPLDEAY